MEFLIFLAVIAAIGGGVLWGARTSGARLNAPSASGVPTRTSKLQTWPAR